MLKTLVKISNISNLSDARYCAGMGVELLGFSMDNLPIERFSEIRNWVAGVQIVGETDSDNLTEIKQKIETYRPDYLQISNINLLPQLTDITQPIILKVNYEALDSPTFVLPRANTIAYLLLESADEFLHLENNVLAQLNKIAMSQNLLLGFGLTEANLHETLDEVPLRGIALIGGQELRPGYKEMDELMNMLESLEVED
jgi:phosphoribosylanthranilate isomerase